jgi:hypothetical protein
MPMIEALRCAKCNTFVRRWETWYDATTGEHVFRASCHGEEDECRLDMSRIDPRQVVEAVAFRDKLLEHK